MKPAKVKVYIAIFAYGGNGGLAMVAPELAIWLAKTYHEMLIDERIESVAIKVYSDTPITLTRNRAVRDSKSLGADFVLMLDSDNQPDGYAHCGAAPFWKTAFDFSYDRLLQGIPTVIAAPYCGPPPNPTEKPSVREDGDVIYEKIYTGEVPYLFQWSNNESDNPEAHMSLDILTRNEAARLSGIQPMAALPTGVCMFSLSCFEGMAQPYFKYEMNEDGSEKKSTEDVVATRDISLFWKIKKNYDVVYATCDSWALHHKTKKVGRPQFIPLETIADTFRDTIRRNQSENDSMEQIDYTAQLENIPRKHQILGPDDNFVLITDEEMEEARMLLEQEEMPRGATWTAMDAGTDPDYGTITVANDGREHKNGDSALRHKMVASRKVAILDEEIPDKTLNAISDLAALVVKENDSSPVDVVVAHPGTGQSSAAIISKLPEGSHLYALDCVNTYNFSTAYADQFIKSFQPELESGRVMADLSNRKFPWPPDQHHLDFVFIERAIKPGKLSDWMKHVRPGGILAGLGFEGNAKLISGFAADNGYSIRTLGDVWAISNDGRE